MHTPAADLVVQRNCACDSGPSGPSGGCKDCHRKKLGLQPKLRVGAHGDGREQEADRLAEQVMRMPGPAHAGDSAPLEGGPLVQRWASGDTSEQTEAPPIVHEVLASSGHPLDAATRAFFEPRFGHDFSRIRLHTGARAEESANSVDALAYTVGQHVVLGRSAPPLPNSEGRRVLAHELTHAIQQDSGAPNTQLKAQHGLPSVQRSRIDITKPGTVAHRGEVGAAPPGTSGPSIGKVEVRTGEEIELVSGMAVPNVIALEYSGSLSADSKWLQFLWLEAAAMTPEGPVRDSSAVLTNAGWVTLTDNPAAPNWVVDNFYSPEPFYDSANIRTSSSITIFDIPLSEGARGLAQALFTAHPTATKVVLTAHFDTYLIQQNASAYHVAFSASAAFLVQAGSSSASEESVAPRDGELIGGTIGYTVGAAGPVTALPSDLKATLIKQYPKFDYVK
ncbi:MAG: DUF4157 domain-containing protein [Pseudonocardiaceae bacterium]